ncbi:MAG: type II toxin-antitoxin system VapC family toxin [Sporichthyaceae bacterium]
MHLDTHVVVWLYESGADRFPESARRRLEGEDLAVSAIVELELAFLNEIGRLAPLPHVVLGELERTVGLRRSTAALPSVVGAAVPLTWTRDPFDRLICADAVVCGADLLTKDRTIRAHLGGAHWD